MNGRELKAERTFLENLQWRLKRKQASPLPLPRFTCESEAQPGGILTPTPGPYGDRRLLTWVLAVPAIQFPSGSRQLSHPLFKAEKSCQRPAVRSCLPSTGPWCGFCAGTGVLGTWLNPVFRAGQPLSRGGPWGTV